jgi:hypothetical protein
MIVHKTNSDRLISHYHLDVGDYANEAGGIQFLIRLSAFSSHLTAIPGHA